MFIKAQDLFDDMYSSLADRSTKQMINRLARIDVLQIDELGYLNLRPEQANAFFKLMDERYTARKATIITTNIEFEDWGRQLGDAKMAEALLSRLRHRCTTIRIAGPLAVIRSVSAVKPEMSAKSTAPEMISSRGSVSGPSTSCTSLRIVAGR